MLAAMKHRFVRRCALAFAVSAIAAPLSAAANQAPFAEWLADLWVEARERGVSEAILDAALSDIAPIERVIELDRRQPEGTITFEQYLSRIVTDGRVREGRERLAQNRALLEEVAARFGVQPRFIVALWGIETSFGNFTGGFPVVDALATLAYDGRRSAYFRGELLQALQILDEGHITPEDMRGSWAGAMGQAQFMPSSFLSYAFDYDGDGQKDIWKTRADVFASAANYLGRVGWRDDITWGRRVQLPAGFDVALTGVKTRKRLSEWQALGVRRADGTDLPTRDLEASVVMPDGPDGSAYVVYDNYRALLRWNRSLYFATAVGHLADRIGGS